MAMASHAPLSSCLGAASITPNERPQNVRELSAALHGRTAASIKKAPPLPLAMAESRVVLLGFLSYYGLVPSPEEVCSVPDCDARAERARWRSVLPDDVDVEGAYITAVRTWGVFVALHVRSGAYRKPVGHNGCSLAAVTTRAPATGSTLPPPACHQFRARNRAQALFILASLKGYFTNFYPALLHCDKDRYIEIWGLVRCPGPYSDPGRAPGCHAADTGGTHLPLRGLVLQLLPNVDVAHAFFRHELHAGHDGSPGAASLLRGSADGWPCAFQLQSGGCKVQGDELDGTV